MAICEGRLPILNLWVDPIDMAGAVARVREFVEKKGRLHTLLAVNPEKSFSVPKDPFLHNAFRQADLLFPDGIGVVLAARLLFGKKMTRVAGADLMERICALAAKWGYKVFVYGAKEEVNRSAVETLQTKYPGLNVVGRAHGYLKENEMLDLVRRINDSGAEILFLALGSPRQERWIAEYGGLLKTVRVCQGIGGTLDTIAGTVKRAPPTWQYLGLEWLYRLVSDPRRIGRQRALPVFAGRVLAEKMRRTLPAGMGGLNSPLQPGVRRPAYRGHPGRANRPASEAPHRRSRHTPNPHSVASR